MGTARKVPAILLLGAALGAGSGAIPVARAAGGALQNPGNGHWYLLLPATNRSWDFQEATAESLGGYLATITSPAEQQWLENLLPPGGTRTYLGGTDRNKEGTWTWVSHETWGWTHWAAGEPDNGASAVEQDVLAFGGPQGASWIDEDAAGAGGAHACIFEWNFDPNGSADGSSPAAPSDLVASVNQGGPITLAWIDHSDVESAFQIERRSDALAFTHVATVRPDVVRWEDYDTVPGTSYAYRVRAVNLVGASGYTNEASAVAGSIEKAPLPPNGLVVAGTTPDSVTLSWIDRSDDEVAFQVGRLGEDGTFAGVGLVSADEVTFREDGLAADASFVYGVRAVGPFGFSAWAQVAAVTGPTFAVTARTGELRDSGSADRDSLRATASFELLEGESGDAPDPVALGISIRAGPDAAPLLLRILPGDPRWKVRGSVDTWRSGKGSPRRSALRIDRKRRTVTLSFSRAQLAGPPSNPMCVSLAIGRDGGTARDAYEEVRPGRLRLPRDR